MTRTAVSLVMTRDVVTVELDTPYKRIVVLLSDHRIGAVPVLEGGAVVGVVSETDLLAKPERYDQPDPPAGGHLGRARQLRRKADALRAEELMTGPAVTVLPAT